jgi:hypothetical protein
MPCAARYQETTSLEFILNPFKFFFTNYVKKSRVTEHWQASLVKALSATYNLAPLATIDARIKAALLPDCGVACNVPQAPKTCWSARHSPDFPHLLKHVVQPLLAATHCSRHCAASQACTRGALPHLPVRIPTYRSACATRAVLRHARSLQPAPSQYVNAQRRISVDTATRCYTLCYTWRYTHFAWAVPHIRPRIRDFVQR